MQNLKSMTTIILLPLLITLCSFGSAQIAQAREYERRNMSFEETREYTVTESQEMEKIDSILHNHKDWRYIMGRYEYARSHKSIHEDMKRSMHLGVLQKVETLQSAEIISQSMALIITVEFQKAIGIAPEPPKTLKDIYLQIKTETSGLEALIAEGKICQWVSVIAQKNGGEKLQILQKQKESFKTSLKASPQELQKIEERLEGALSTLQGLYPEK